MSAVSAPRGAWQRSAHLVGALLVFAVSLHGFIVGQPFRLRPLRQAIRHCVGHAHKDRVWFTRAGDIAKYCVSLPPGLIPGSPPG